MPAGEIIAWVVLFVSVLYLADRFVIWAGTRWWSSFRAKRAAARPRENAPAERGTGGDARSGESSRTP
jgi:hypothetical protein